MDWPRHSCGAYANDQAEAQAARQGIWQGEFQPPWEWRAAKQASKSEETSAASPIAIGICDIKGNVGKKGERIYHVPSQRFCMFCSEEEARAADWRRAKR